MARSMDRLDDWVEVGLVTPEQAERITAYERGDLDVDAVGAAGDREGTDPTAPPRTTTDDRPRGAPSRSSLAEALGYVGAALALGAIGLLLGELWRELLVGGRLTLVGVLTIAVFGAGLALRTGTAAALQRLTNVLFVATVAGVGWFAGVVADDVLELDWSATGAWIGLSMFVVALSLLLWRGGWLLQLASLGSALLATGMLLSVLDPQLDQVWFGATIATVGLAWAILARGAWLGPRVLGETTGAVAVLFGVQVAAWGDSRTAVLVVGVVIAALLVGIAVRSDALHHLVVGALGLFVFSPQLVFEVFGDAIGGPASLLVVGLLLVVLAVGLGRARREVTPHGPADGDVKGGGA